MDKVIFSSKSSEWETPKELFDELDKEFSFDLDPCCTKENAKCRLFITKEEDGLKEPWLGNVFMNPPYGREIGKWVRKAFEESRRAAVVVCLLPARTDTAWVHDYCIRGHVRVLRGRLYFTDQDGKTGRAPFPSMIVIF